MDQYCIVLCGLQAGAPEDAVAWQPVAAALKLDHDEFEQRVVAALPRIVRQDLDRVTADRVAQLLHAIHVDARVLPDDSQLAYIELVGASCGPLPRSSLGDFIQPGESYRLYGSTTWQLWPAPVDEESSAVAAVDPGDVDDATPAFDEPDHTNDIAREEEAPDAVTGLPDPMPPAVQPSSTAEPFGDIDGTAPGPDATAPADDDDLIHPPPVTPAPDAPDAAEPVSAEFTPAAATGRSRTGRLVLLVVVVALAVWAYRYWTENTPVVAPPVAAGAIQPAGADAGPSTPPARVVAGADATPRPASQVSAAVAGSTPAPATTAVAPASAGSTPRPAASTIAPSVAASTPAPAATIQAPAASVTAMLPASAGTAMPAPPVR